MWCISETVRVQKVGTHGAVFPLLLLFVLARRCLHCGKVRLAGHGPLVLSVESLLVLCRCARKALLHWKSGVLRRDRRRRVLLALLVHLSLLLLLLLVPLVCLHDTQLVVSALRVLLGQLVDLRLKLRTIVWREVLHRLALPAQCLDSTAHHDLRTGCDSQAHARLHAVLLLLLRVHLLRLLHLHLLRMLLLDLVLLLLGQMLVLLHLLSMMRL